MLHIKLKGMERIVPYKHIFCPTTHAQPMGLGQMVLIFFSESGFVAYQYKLKEVNTNIDENTLTLHP